MEWSEEWPIEPGMYWLYGYPHGKGRIKSDPLRHLCIVWKISNGATYVCDGHFIYKSQAGKVMFKKAEFPAIPEDF